MNIAFISYEYPIETGFGGIATYVYQIANLFSERGIDVHVVCGSFKEEKCIVENDHLTIHLLQCKNRKEFKILAPGHLLSIHQKTKIDIIEAPDYGAESINIKPALPDVPLIIKFHTPSYLVKKLNDYYYDRRLERKIKYLFFAYKPERDEEYIAALKADFLLSPSHSMADIISKDWKIERSKIKYAPNPYEANHELLNISAETINNRILYVGRLETRKGVYNLSKAIPIVLREIPDAEFIFLGRDDRSPWRTKSMKDILLREIGEYKESVQFIDQVPLFEIPHFLKQAAICVFPSLWENFPNVCLEAMSAARAIVASRNGGMYDMLASIENAYLIDPDDTQQIAQSINFLLKNKKERIKYATDCRKKIIEYYSSKLIDELMILYQGMIKIPS